MAREAGGSTNGKASTSPSPREVISSTTEASEVRRISGSVNSGLPSKSSWENRRMAMPGPVRPERPERWFALRSEEHTSELQSRGHLVCRLLLEKKKKS